MDYLPTLLSLSLLSLSLLSLSHCHSISDLLMSRGLPAGLFPDTVRDYELDPNGRLQVFMDQPCTAKFETRVFFESVVRANLSYGGLIGVEGLSQEELFLWLPVKDIIVYDPSSGLILFDIGIAQKEFSLSLFEDPPVCMPQGVPTSLSVTVSLSFLYIDTETNYRISNTVSRTGGAQ
ncbi:uncharacterized protein LOC130794494 isoform X2 [Actinidia eriantha]|uniref:uncharacterized protein LOC130794494 isoform X2 n=1 Tax=Actinidia eriantha TaxID=165200 RepID=UPI00258DA53E|nr:uncharacterized protein LOC130794494 isoform X2 [Actinidia eriantha]